jgi:hypothetical protein
LPHPRPKRKVPGDRNRYSIEAKAANRPVQLRAYADRVVVRFDGEVVATHERVFGRDRVRYNPLHYLPVLARKPGALRNGAPFKDWELPPNLTKLRARLGRSDEADRQFVDILAAIPEDGLDAVEEACRLALSEASDRALLREGGRNAVRASNARRGRGAPGGKPPRRSKPKRRTAAQRGRGQEAS